jgi:hypothetical protein
MSRQQPDPSILRRGRRDRTPPRTVERERGDRPASDRPQPARKSRRGSRETSAVYRAVPVTFPSRPSGERVADDVKVGVFPRALDFERHLDDFVSPRSRLRREKRLVIASPTWRGEDGAEDSGTRRSGRDFHSCRADVVFGRIGFGGARCRRESDGGETAQRRVDEGGLAVVRSSNPSIVVRDAACAGGGEAAYADLRRGGRCRRRTRRGRRRASFR